MAVSRIVPNLASKDLAKSSEFFENILGLEEVMDLGWIVTMAEAQGSKVQMSLVNEDEGGPTPRVSIEVDDIDAVYASAIAAGAEIPYELTEEPWGVRRFFLADPDGNTFNIMSH